MTTGTLHYKSEKANGVASTGLLKVAINTTKQIVRDPVGNIVFQGPLTAKLVDGEVTLTLPATDDGTLSPTEFTYTTTEQLDHVSKSDYRVCDFTLPGGTTRDLADVPDSVEVAADPSYGASLGAALAEVDALRDGSDATFESRLTASFAALNPSVAGFQNGDSFTEGVGASDTAHRYSSLLAAAKGITPTNNGQSGAQAWDQAGQAFAQTIALGQTNTLLIGTNDHRTYGTSEAKRQEWSRALSALIWWLATPATQKLLNGNSAVVLGGSGWAGSGAYPSAVSTASNGATATVKASGRAVYLVAVAQEGNDATYSLTVDGRDYGTFAVGTSGMTTVLTKTYGPRLHRFAGLADGEHIIVLTKVSGSDPVYFVAAGGSAGQRALTAPLVAVGTISRMTSGGYGSAGGSDTTVRQYNEALAQVVAQLADDGLNVCLADTAVDPATMLTGDGVHPNDAGHAFIADGFEAALARYTYSRERRGPASRGGQMVGCKVKRSSSQSVSSSSLTAITWNAEEYDTHGFHSTSVNSSRLTVPAGQEGYYRVEGGWCPDAPIGSIIVTGGTATVPRVVARIKATGNDVPGGAIELPGAVFTTPNLSTVVYLREGEYVELFIYHDGGSSVGTDYTFAGMSLTKIAPPVNGVWASGALPG